MQFLFYRATEASEKGLLEPQQAFTVRWPYFILFNELGGKLNPRNPLVPKALTTCSRERKQQEQHKASQTEAKLTYWF